MDDLQITLARSRTQTADDDQSMMYSIIIGDDDSFNDAITRVRGDIRHFMMAAFLERGHMARKIYERQDDDDVALSYNDNNDGIADVVRFIMETKIRACRAAEYGFDNAARYCMIDAESVDRVFRYGIGHIKNLHMDIYCGLSMRCIMSAIGHSALIGTMFAFPKMSMYEVTSVCAALHIDAVDEEIAYALAYWRGVEVLEKELDDHRIDADLNDVLLAAQRLDLSVVLRLSRYCSTYRE